MSTHPKAPAETSGYIPPPDAPQWFIQNLRQPGESLHAVVHYSAAAKSRIHFLAWNWHDKSLPVLVFVHGFSGHANWWSYLAPFFTDRYRVAAVDLPGMGDSDHFTVYDEDCFARSVIEMLRQHGVGQATLVGHSFGGSQAIRALAMAPELFSHGIIIDTMVRPPTHLAPQPSDGRSRHRLRANRTECVRDFRLKPPQPILMQTLVDFVAFHSCTPTNGGWHWKFDPALHDIGQVLFGGIRSTDIPTRVHTRVDCIYGELSLFGRDGQPREMLESFRNHGELIIVPGAYHHLMLDHPLELVAALNHLLAAVDTR